MIADIVRWLAATSLGDFMNTSSWAWIVAECLHFTGLTLVVGTVWLFDLRVLGVGKGWTPHDLHRLVPFGIAGFCISLMTGIAFVCGAPDQYFYNVSFHLKAVFLAIAGANLAYFYARPYRSVRELGPFDTASLEARICAGISIVAMTGVMLFGRLLTFYRPIFAFPYDG